MVIDMESCIKKSIEQYQSIIDHAAQLEGLLKKADPEEISVYTRRMQELQDEASLHDRVFHDLFIQNSDHWKNHPLFVERTRLLGQIVALNQQILPKIRGIMAMTVHELSQIKSGRTVVSGYHPPARQSRQSLSEVG